MHIKKTIFLITCLILSYSCFADEMLRPASNLSTLKDEVVTYHDSKAFDYDIQIAVNQAYAVLDKAIKNKTNKEKLAIVFDVDDTLLSSYKFSKQNLYFGYNKKIISANELSGNMPRIMATYNLADYADKNNITIFFITGRPDKNKILIATYKNLFDQGFKTVGKNIKDYKKYLPNISDCCTLFLKPKDYDKKSIVPFKSSIRKSIQQAGYTIILNMGDQSSDLAGGFSKNIFKLPNYRYTLD